MCWLPGVILTMGFSLAAQSAPLPSTNTISLASLVEPAQGRAGVYAECVESGEVISYRGDALAPQQSVYKVPIGMVVLQQVEAGRLALDQPVTVTTNDYVGSRQHSPLRDAHPQGTTVELGELLRLMISESDGSACDVLLRLVGGPEAVSRALHLWGITQVQVAATEQAMGAHDWVQYQNSATAGGYAALLKQLLNGPWLAPTNRALMLRWMTVTTTGPRRLKGLLPPGTVVAHKTGSARTVNGITPATNDAGIISLPDGRHLIVVVFVADSRAAEADREMVIARITRALWDQQVTTGHLPVNRDGSGIVNP